MTALTYFSMPAAVNLNQLATINNYAIDETATILFVQNLCAIFTLPIFMSISLLIVTSM